MGGGGREPERRPVARQSTKWKRGIASRGEIFFGGASYTEMYYLITAMLIFNFIRGTSSGALRPSPPSVSPWLWALPTVSGNFYVISRKHWQSITKQNFEIMILKWQNFEIQSWYFQCVLKVKKARSLTRYTQGVVIATPWYTQEPSVHMTVGCITTQCSQQKQHVTLIRKCDGGGVSALG